MQWSGFHGFNSLHFSCGIFIIIFNSVKTSALCQKLQEGLQIMWDWCWVFFLLRRKGFSCIPCEEHSPFSSWKLSFFTSHGQHDTGREVTASMFHSLSSRAHCSVQKPGHVLISSVLLSEAAICHCSCSNPWGYNLLRAEQF